MILGGCLLFDLQSLQAEPSSIFSLHTILILTVLSGLNIKLHI